MIILEFKLKGKPQQFQALDEAIRTTQFIRNKCLHLWDDGWGVTMDELNRYCRILAQEHAFVRRLNSMAMLFASYYAQFVLNADRRVSADPTGSAIGIDLGLAHFYTDSDGHEKDNPRLLRRSERALVCLHKRVSRKVKGSKNRARARNRLARKYLQVERQRRDFAVKTARALVMSYDVIAIEDLHVANTVKNKHLAKSISDAGWRVFRAWLEYLARVFGKYHAGVLYAGNHAPTPLPSRSTLSLESCAARSGFSRDADAH